MKLEILRTYVDLISYDGNSHRPNVMSIGGFEVALDNTKVSYDNFESYGGWDEEEKAACIEWICRGGSEVFKIDNEDIGEEGHIFEFDKLPIITEILEIYYEAFDDIPGARTDYLFDLKNFAIEFIDRENNKVYVVEASDEVIKKYNETN